MLPSLFHSVRSATFVKAEITIDLNDARLVERVYSTVFAGRL
jgi:hypothetical protein